MQIARHPVDVADTRDELATVCQRAGDEDVEE
jgi:hypothetical protein